MDSRIFTSLSIYDTNKMIEFRFKKKNSKYKVLTGFHNSFSSAHQNVYDICFWFDPVSYYEVASFKLRLPDKKKKKKNKK
jgi:hypothetical protein